MKRALFLPLLTISSGHHQVADTIQSELAQQYDCRKVELLSYTFGRGEQLISQFYLKWIQLHPSLYSAIYKRIANSKSNSQKHLVLFERLFLKKIRKLIDDYRPDVIICTHALPSGLLNGLKKQDNHYPPVVNVYTDFYINDLWGKAHIDFHIVPDEKFKVELMEKGVPLQRILTAGIPIHRVIKPALRRSHQNKTRYQILVSGGNLGTGKLLQFIRKLNPGENFYYQILCGKNQKLFKKIEQLHQKAIEPLPYIQSRRKMNELYENCDAIITKPGGVTISECLSKRMPIFVYDCLPGQEEYNLHHLTSCQLVHSLTTWNDVESQLDRILGKPQLFQRTQSTLQQFHDRLEHKPIGYVIDQLLSQSQSNV